MTAPGRTESKQAKSQPIEKRQVWEAWKHVRQGGKAVGVDELTIQEIDRDPGRYLYTLWNRLASGSYMAPPVREKSIPVSGHFKVIRSRTLESDPLGGRGES